MKNKKGVQMNQMKNDLAKLLQSNQDRTARIRVCFFDLCVFVFVCVIVCVLVVNFVFRVLN